MAQVSFVGAGQGLIVALTPEEEQITNWVITTYGPNFFSDLVTNALEQRRTQWLSTHKDAVYEAYKAASPDVQASIDSTVATANPLLINKGKP